MFTTKTQIINYMVILEDELELLGTGIPGLKAKLVARKGKVCWYQRSDDVHEVFVAQVSPEGEVFGRIYPERETYPCNEDFGHTAWCYRSRGEAEKRFTSLSGIPES